MAALCRSTLLLALLVAPGAVVADPLAYIQVEEFLSLPPVARAYYTAGTLDGLNVALFFVLGEDLICPAGVDAITNQAIARMFALPPSLRPVENAALVVTLAAFDAGCFLQVAR